MTWTIGRHRHNTRCASNPKLIVTIRAQFATIKDPQPPINSSGGRVAHAAITRTRVTRAVFCDDPTIVQLQQYFTYVTINRGENRNLKSKYNSCFDSFHQKFDGVIVGIKYECCWWLCRHVVKCDPGIRPSSDSDLSLQAERMRMSLHKYEKNMRVVTGAVTAICHINTSSYSTTG